MFHITAIDLYGNAFYTETIALPYSNTEEYYRQLTDKVRKFIAENHYPNEKILGISIATQGITSPDNSTVIYGNIMNNTGMKLEDFPGIFLTPAIWNMIPNPLLFWSCGITRSLTVLSCSF